MMKTSEKLRPYISVCANIRLPMKEAGLLLDALAAHGRSMMRWRLDNQAIQQCGGSKTLMWSIAYELQCSTTLH